ncbi:hypothetical protein CCP1ISM_160018 [Azospirillaceae bacterium]
MIVNAKISGDGECFCFSVDIETYIKLFGKEKYDQEVKFQKESCDEIGMEYEERTIWHVYPNQLLGLIGKDKEVKLEIITDSRLINQIIIS